jgi:hypothetical protein
MDCGLRFLKVWKLAEDDGELLHQGTTSRRLLRLRIPASGTLLPILNIHQQ